MFSLFFALLLGSIDLSPYEQKVYSQNGEDGVLQKIFEVIGTTNRFYVEFGVENGLECNTRFLHEACGWEGVLLDSAFENRQINLHQEFITAENINELFAKYQVPHALDLLCIDIDYNDFYVWKALDGYSPRVVVVEYNASWGPHEDKVVIYQPFYCWDKTNYFGASILTLCKLGRLKGYTLIYAENKGVNLFFLRDDIANKHHFKHAGNVHKLYKSARYGLGPNGGHVADPYYRPFITFEEAIRELVTK